MLSKRHRFRLPPVLAFISLILAILGGGAFVFETQAFLDRQVEREQAASAARSLGRFLQAVNDMETSQRGYLLTERQEYLRPFERGSRQARAELRRLRSSPLGQAPARKLAPLAAQKESELRETIALSKAGKEPEALEMVLSDSGRRDMRSMREIIDESSESLAARQDQLLLETQERLRSSKIAFFIWIAALGGLLGVALLSSRRARLRLAVVTRRLAHEATHDPFTRLPNRRYLGEWLERAVAEAERDGAPLSALYLDLDGFSQINNTLGHEAGDTALLSTCAALRPLLKPSDFIARVGGDEFVIISPGANAQEAQRLGQGLVDALETLSPVEGSPVGLLGVSVGVAAFPDRPDAKTLLAAADAAMYDAKRAGKRRVCLSPPDAALGSLNAG